MSNVLATSLISTDEDISKVTDITDHVLAAINMFKDHQSIKNIRAKNFKSVFSIIHTNKIEIQNILRDMKVHRNCVFKDIPTKIINMNADIYANLFIHYPLHRY